MPDFEMSKSIPGKVVVTATAQWAEHGEALTGTRLIRIGFDLDETAPNGRNQDSVDLYLSPKSLGISRKALEALGIDFQKVPAEDFNTDNGLTKLIGGKRCRLTYIEEERDNGQRRWRASWINPLMKKPKGGNALEMLQSVKSKKEADPGLLVEHAPRYPDPKEKEEEVPF